eukprot:832400-Pyramimonas_sp.AAC.1
MAFPADLESGDCFAGRSPPGMARSNLDPRRVPICSPPEQPSKMAAVSQIAAPHAWRGLLWIRGECPFCWHPQQPSKVAT